MAKTTMTEGSRKVFEYLKSAGAGVKFTTKQVQEALGFEKSGSVTGSVNGLVKKGYAERFKEPEEKFWRSRLNVLFFFLLCLLWFTADLISSSLP